jgi:hypothetical protein
MKKQRTKFETLLGNIDTLKESKIIKENLERQLRKQKKLFDFKYKK